MSIYDSLNTEQKEAVLHTEGPLLILAGAGSGKTRVLTHRIAYLIDACQVNPWNILAITFTNKAAGEMRERVDALIGEDGLGIWVSTFHSCCVRILRRHIENLGMDQNFVIYDSDDSKSLMKEICRSLELDTKVYKEKSLLADISRAKNQMISVEKLEKEAYSLEDQILAKVYRAYQKALKNNNALDFDDLLVKTVELFQRCPSVLQYYQERFRYIMIDEYQDTNHVQFLFVKLLADRYKNLCVVGDDDQSIYSFRGADINNILDFEDAYPNAKVIRLEQNYRSTGTILKAANAVIENNSQRKRKTLRTENEEGALIHVRSFRTGYDEAEYVAEQIGRAKGQGKAQYRDFAILYRTNAQSRLFEEKLIAAGIPYKLVGGVNFYARKEIKDLLCYLRVIDNARDDLAVKRIINVPKRGIGSATISKAADFAEARGISFYEALEHADEMSDVSGAARKKLTGFLNFIRVLKASAEDLTVLELLQEVIEKTGYRNELIAEGTEEARGRIENIDELLNTVADFEKKQEELNQRATLSGFLTETSLIADIDSVQEGEDYVLLLTIHSAKGLEFPRVFLVGMEENIFPSYAAINYGTDGSLEEERRLCYVGITRAMKVLTLSFAKMRMVRGNMQPQKCSRFVIEVPRELVDLDDEQTGERMDAPVRFIGDRLDEQSGQLFRPKTPVRKSTPVMRQSFESMQKGAPKKADHLSYGEGDTVRHVKFGTGVVKTITDGARDYEVTVEFEQYGVKKMLAGFAKLEKI